MTPEHKVFLKLMCVVDKIRSDSESKYSRYLPKDSSINTKFPLLPLLPSLPPIRKTTSSNHHIVHTSDRLHSAVQKEPIVAYRRHLCFELYFCLPTQPPFLYQLFHTVTHFNLKTTLLVKSPSHFFIMICMISSTFIYTLVKIIIITYIFSLTFTILS